MAQQQISKRALDEINRSGFGDEPASGCALDKSALIRALNWYSVMKERSDAKEYLTVYCRSRFPDKVALVESIDEAELNCSMCWIARMIERGVTSPFIYEENLQAYISSLARRVRAVSKKSSTEESPSMRDGKLDQLLILVEDAIDRFDTTFSCYDMLVSAATAHRIAGRIADYYQPQLEELKLAVEKKDPQCMDAYHHMKYADLRKFYQMVSSIVEDARRFKDNLIKTRKPKKNSTNKTKDVLKHFKYQEKDDLLKISSINPLAIIGAKELYVYNTARKTLTVFKAKESGLKISRSSIDNYDEATSISKRVSGRNLPAIIKHVENSNARARTKAIDSVNSDPSPLSDRISSNVVLLRALK